jgi:hypothetical protein
LGRASLTERTAAAARKQAAQKGGVALGDQLTVGPVLLDLGGNPLGFAGTRQVRTRLAGRQALTLTQAFRPSAPPFGTHHIPTILQTSYFS